MSDEQLFLQIDGQTVGAISDFVMDKPAHEGVWGPVYVHQRRPPTCQFSVAGMPDPGGWATIVDGVGMGVHDVKLLSMKSSIVMGKGAVTAVKAQIIKD